jgi:hypothetical protein
MIRPLLEGFLNGLPRSCDAALTSGGLVLEHPGPEEDPDQDQSECDREPCSCRAGDDVTPEYGPDTVDDVRDRVAAGSRRNATRRDWSGRLPASWVSSDFADVQDRAGVHTSFDESPDATRGVFGLDQLVVFEETSKSLHGGEVPFRGLADLGLHGCGKHTRGRSMTPSRHHGQPARFRLSAPTGRGLPYPPRRKTSRRRPSKPPPM